MCGCGGVGHGQAVPYQQNNKGPMLHAPFSTPWLWRSTVSWRDDAHELVDFQGRMARGWALSQRLTLLSFLPCLLSLPTSTSPFCVLRYLLCVKTKAPVHSIMVNAGTRELVLSRCHPSLGRRTAPLCGSVGVVRRILRPLTRAIRPRLHSGFGVATPRSIPRPRLRATFQHPVGWSPLCRTCGGVLFRFNVVDMR